MTVFFLVFAGLLGSIVGSFLNVVIWRLPRGESIVRPRSRCPQCQKTISAFDNVPILSWLLLRGRCRGCQNPIPVRYPLVELLTAALFVAAAWRWADHLPTAGLVAAALAAFVAISFIDWEHKIIPDRITKPGIVVAIALAPISVGEGLLHPEGWIENVTPALGAWLHAGAGAIAGAAVIYGIRLLGFLVFRKEAMGLGDAKLLALIGALTGPLCVLYTLVLASVAGALIGGLRWLIGKWQPLRVGLDLAWQGGKASFEEAWVEGDHLSVLAPPETETAPEQATIRLTLPAADVLEEEDVQLKLKGALDAGRARGGPSRWRFRIDEPSDEERELLAFFAQSRRYVPFGPFLALGGTLTLFFGEKVHWLIVEGYPTWARSLFS